MTRKQYNESREITSKGLGITKNNYNWLRRKGQALHKIYEDACNGIVNYDGEYDRLTEPIEEQVNNYAKCLGLYVYYQTDPRGATIYIDKQPIPDNNYTQAECIF